MSLYRESPGCGSIELILGPMFSGKTTEMLRRAKRHQIAGLKCLVVKYDADRRYDAARCATHDNLKADARPVARLAEVADWREFDVLGIDEGQFFEDIVEFCEEAANAGKRVIVAALDGTFQRKPFNRILELVPLSESVVKLSSVCMVCHGDASFSHRTTTDKKVEVIGGEDKYIAVCRKCYHNHTPGKQITDFFPATKPAKK